MVICVPRLTVSAAGQMVLFWITSVAGLALGVQAPLGLVMPFDAAPLLPHAIAKVIAARVLTVIRVLMVLEVRASGFQSVLRQVIGQRALADAHQLGRILLHAAGVFQRPPDRFALDPFDV